jgi:hypothetical protein
MSVGDVWRKYLTCDQRQIRQRAQVCVPFWMQKEWARPKSHAQPTFRKFMLAWTVTFFFGGRFNLLSILLPLFFSLIFFSLIFFKVGEQTTLRIWINQRIVRQYQGQIKQRREKRLLIGKKDDVESSTLKVAMYAKAEGTHPEKCKRDDDQWDHNDHGSNSKSLCLL